SHSDLPGPYVDSGRSRGGEAGAVQAADRRGTIAVRLLPDAVPDSPQPIAGGSYARRARSLEPSGIRWSFHDVQRGGGPRTGRGPFRGAARRTHASR